MSSPWGREGVRVVRARRLHLWKRLPPATHCPIAPQSLRCHSEAENYAAHSQRGSDNGTKDTFLTNLWTLGENRRRRQGTVPACGKNSTTARHFVWCQFILMPLQHPAGWCHQQGLDSLFSQETGFLVPQTPTISTGQPQEDYSEWFITSRVG